MSYGLKFCISSVSRTEREQKQLGDKIDDLVCKAIVMMTWNRGWDMICNYEFEWIGNWDKYC